MIHAGPTTRQTSRRIGAAPSNNLGFQNTETVWSWMRPYIQLVGRSQMHRRSGPGADKACLQRSQNTWQPALIVTNQMAVLHVKQSAQAVAPQECDTMQQQLAAAMRFCSGDAPGSQAQAAEDVQDCKNFNAIDLHSRKTSHCRLEHCTVLALPTRLLLMACIRANTSAKSTGVF